ncbi:MAG: hypothetical protein Q9181_007184, partial [Wetmoreana brouardii]
GGRIQEVVYLLCCARFPEIDRDCEKHGPLPLFHDPLSDDPRDPGYTMPGSSSSDKPLYEWRVVEGHIHGKVLFAGNEEVASAPPAPDSSSSNNRSEWKGRRWRQRPTPRSSANRQEQGKVQHEMREAGTPWSFCRKERRKAKNKSSTNMHGGSSSSSDSNKSDRSPSSDDSKPDDPQERKPTVKANLHREANMHKLSEASTEWISGASLAPPTYQTQVKLCRAQGAVMQGGVTRKNDGLWYQDLLVRKFVRNVILILMIVVQENENHT